MLLSKNKQGFTIVELLIVIVVIGILAAITIVAFNGVQKRAADAAVKSEVTSALKQISVFATTNGDTYPTAITCPTPAAGEACVLANTKSTVVYAQTADTRKSFCLSATNTSGASYYVTEAGKVSSGSCSLKSCYEIQQAGGSTGSGNYWIRPTGSTSSIPVYCDMATSGGGWTLLVTNVAGGTDWTPTTVRSFNSGVPSTNSQYSILDKADSIKANIGNKLQYRIDATSFGLWGGVWEAPFSNTFAGTTAVNNATNTEMYGSWAIDTTIESTQTLTNVMPWINTTPQLLTTFGGAGNWFGTIVSGQTGWNAAPFLDTAHPKPVVIWYWVK